MSTTAPRTGLRFRIHPGCLVWRDDDGLALRRGARLFVVSDPEPARHLAALLSRDRDAAGATGSEHGDVAGAIRVLGALSDAGMLVVDDAVPLAPPAPARALTGSFRVVGDAHTAAAVVDALTAAGGRATAADAADADAALAADRDELIIVCANGRTREQLAAVDVAARAAARRWVSLLFHGDEVLVGPLYAPDEACQSCFELRWLGLAPSIARERRWYAEACRRADAVATIDGLAAWMARELVDWLADGPAAATLRIADPWSGRRSAHRFVRHPGCSCVAAPPRSQTSAFAGWRSQRAVAASPADLAARLEPLCDDRVGLVGDTTVLGDPPPPLDGALLVTAVARFAVPEPRRVRRDTANVSHGCAPDGATARLVAVVEALERYAGLGGGEPVVRAPFRDVAAEAIDPRTLPLYSAAQYARPGFPYRPFADDVPIDWTWAYSLAEERRRLVPRDAVFYGSGADRLFDETSSGMAAHGTPITALCRAVGELVERDAFVLFWCNRLSPPLLDVDALPSPLGQRAFAEMRALGYAPFVADLTTDLDIPVLLALAVGDGRRGPALLLGAAAGVDALGAAERAVVELHSAVRHHQRQPWSPARLLREEEVTSLHDHAAAYAHPAWLPKAQFLWQGAPGARLRPGIVPSDPGAELALLEERLQRRGLAILAADVTPADVAGRGLHVVRALVPGLQPIGFGRDGLRLGGRRLYEVPPRLGLAARPRREDELYLVPHCFP